MHIYFYEIIFVSVITVCLAILRIIGIRRIKKYYSKLLGEIEVWERFNGERSLTINRYTHGISINRKSIDQSYWYAISRLALIHCKKIKNPRILFLGLGANTSSLLISNQNPGIEITIIEIDSSIIDACKSYFKLGSVANLNLIEGDAYELIDSRKDFNNLFDVIVIDIFTGNPPYVSTRSDKPTFIQKLMYWSKPDGLLIFNRPANTEQALIDSDLLKTYLSSILSNVKELYIHDPRGFKNKLLTAIVKKTK